MVEEDEFRRDMMLSLLPNELWVQDHCLRVEYKPLADSRLMMVLTNVTEEIKLKEQVDQEHRRLAMVVSAVTDQRDVIETIASFRRFLIEIGNGQSKDSKELYRKIHTYKDLFNQFSFISLPEVLHQVESDLGPNGENKYAICVDELWKAFDADMDVIIERLGANFNEVQGFVQVSGQALTELQELINGYLTITDSSLLQQGFVVLKDRVELLNKVELQQLFTPLLRGTYSLAREQGKRIHVAFEGEEVMVERKSYEDFTNSLIHVFRNAVDHGIEMPEQRLLEDKSEVALIKCRYEIQENELLISIEDDGAGIDIESLKEFLMVEKELGQDDIDSIEEHELLQHIFEDSITTCEEVTDISGRGVGLAATKMEVLKLGGSIEVFANNKHGVRTEIRLPWNKDDRISKAEKLQDRMEFSLLEVLTKGTLNYLSNEACLKNVSAGEVNKIDQSPELSGKTAALRVGGIFDAWVIMQFEQRLLLRLTQNFLELPLESINEDDCSDMASELVNTFVGLATQDLNFDSDNTIDISTPILMDEGKVIQKSSELNIYKNHIRTDLGNIDFFIFKPSFFD